MSTNTSSNAFTFSDKFDAAYIYNMYEDDYLYIESMFKVVLDHFDEDLAAIQNNYEQKDIDQLRRSVHKVRPAFGYAGMPVVQEKCKEFENKCMAVKSVSEVETDYYELIKCLEEAGTVISEEHKKLKSFNGACS
ncbi:MAG TPA: Hpt domain-containing protein [Chitinophagaceae bacterium]